MSNKETANEKDCKSWAYKPNIIQIEAVQGCNRRCQFCGTMGIEKQLHFASKKVIEHTARLIAEANFTGRILLAGHGEPTLHPHIIELVSEIRKANSNVTIHMFTNGTIIKKRPELTDKLFRAGLNDLVFDEYRDSPIGDFARNDPICLQYPIAEQKAGTPLFCEKNVKIQRICITPPIDRDENTINRKIENHCGAGGKKLANPYQQVCSTIFRDMMIRYDGSIAICCNDFRGEYYVTNIMKCNTLKEAWLHDRLEAARRFIMQKDRSAIYPCCICDSKPIRAGLLPDARGQMELPKPSALDKIIVSRRHPPLAVIEKREWEK